MAGRDADAEASDAEASAGEPLAPPMAATPLSESARPAAVPGMILGKGTLSATRQLPEPGHVGSTSSSAALRLH